VIGAGAGEASQTQSWLFSETRRIMSNGTIFVRKDDVGGRAKESAVKERMLRG